MSGRGATPLAATGVAGYRDAGGTIEMRSRGTSRLRIPSDRHRPRRRFSRSRYSTCTGTAYMRLRQPTRPRTWPTTIWSRGRPKPNAPYAASGTRSRCMRRATPPTTSRCVRPAGWMPSGRRLTGERGPDGPGEGRRRRTRALGVSARESGRDTRRARMHRRHRRCSGHGAPGCGDDGVCGCGRALAGRDRAGASPGVLGRDCLWIVAELAALFEAEPDEAGEGKSCAYIACRRRGVRPDSASYLAQLIKAGEPVSGTLDVERVMTAAGTVETAMFPPERGSKRRKPKEERS